MFNLLLLTLVFLFCAASPAQAYLDPGTGSYITQAVVGLLAGGGYLIKVYWSRIVLFINSLFGKSKKNDEKKND